MENRKKWLLETWYQQILVPETKSNVCVCVFGVWIKNWINSVSVSFVLFHLTLTHTHTHSHLTRQALNDNDDDDDDCWFHYDINKVLVGKGEKLI